MVSLVPDGDTRREEDSPLVQYGEDQGYRACYWRHYCVVCFVSVEARVCLAMSCGGHYRFAVSYFKSSFLLVDLFVLRPVSKCISALGSLLEQGEDVLSLFTTRAGKRRPWHEVLTPLRMYVQLLL